MFELWHIFPLLILSIMAIPVIWLIWAGIASFRRNRRAKFIDAYTFPDALQTKLKDRYPHLQAEQTQDVINNLREYFHICNEARGRMVAMPSQAVDHVWHEFILYTHYYSKFCKKGIGRFLHHTPTEAMASPTQASSSLKTAWRVACLREKIRPLAPEILPGLFSIDSRLKIEDGFHYSLNCQREVSKKGKKQRGNHILYDGVCASHIACSSGCGGGCASGSGGCSSSGDSGGSSCGGGCGGGGD